MFTMSKRRLHRMTKPYKCRTLQKNLSSNTYERQPVIKMMKRQTIFSCLREIYIVHEILNSLLLLVIHF